jgi:hypothetical protein
LRRQNVALTRAKHCLLVVGCRASLAQHSDWAALLNHFSAQDRVLGAGGTLYCWGFWWRKRLSTFAPFFCVSRLPPPGIGSVRRFARRRWRARGGCGARLPALGSAPAQRPEPCSRGRGLRRRLGPRRLLCRHQLPSPRHCPRDRRR